MTYQQLSLPFYQPTTPRNNTPEIHITKPSSFAHRFQSILQQQQTSTQHFPKHPRTLHKQFIAYSNKHPTIIRDIASRQLINRGP